MGLKLYSITSKYTKKSGMVPSKNLYSKIIFNSNEQIQKFLKNQCKNNGLQFDILNNTNFETRYYTGSGVPQITYYETVETKIKQQLIFSFSENEMKDFIIYNKVITENKKRFWLFSEKINYLSLQKSNDEKYLITIDLEIFFNNKLNENQNYLINQDFINSIFNDYVYNFTEINFSKGLIKKIERFDGLNINDDIKLKNLLISKIQ